jgi:hypothetical protein
MNIAWRVVLFVTGAGVLFFSWHKTHNEVMNLQNPGSSSAVGSVEILIMVAGFLMLLAFAPSQETLGRWMSLKKPKKAHPAQFRRRRQRG